MELSMAEYIIVSLGGFMAGGINSLAGYGSLITLTILMEVMGLPPNVANGTNRVNVMANAAAGSYAYYRNDRLRLRSVWPQIILVLVGAVSGSILATYISNEDFRFLYRILLVLLAVIILVNPRRWLLEKSLDKKTNWFIATPIFLALGFYAGLIQAGSGLFILATLVLFARKEIIESNAIKMFIIFFYSAFVIGIFHFQGLINWKAGLTLAVSQALGSYIIAHYASRIPKANLWAYRLLIIIVLFIIGRELYTMIYF